MSFLDRIIHRAWDQMWSSPASPSYVPDKIPARYDASIPEHDLGAPLPPLAVGVYVTRNNARLRMPVFRLEGITLDGRALPSITERDAKIVTARIGVAVQRVSIHFELWQEATLWLPGHDFALEKWYAGRFATGGAVTTECTVQVSLHAGSDGAPPVATVDRVEVGAPDWEAISFGYFVEGTGVVTAIVATLATLLQRWTYPELQRQASEQFKHHGKRVAARLQAEIQKAVTAALEELWSGVAP